jgi:hypothetical protein
MSAHIVRRHPANPMPKRMFMMKSTLITSAMLCLFALAACSPEGSAEKAGEDMDSAIEEAAQGQINRGDGVLENAGEAIDSATGRQNTDPVDAVNDATDGNANTRP